MKEDLTVQTKGLATGYDGKQILSDVDLKINRGQIVSLIGPNGAGKTTLLKTIIGQLSPMAGVVYLKQQDLQTIGLRELARTLSVVLTVPLQEEWMTVEDVVEMGRYPYTGSFGMLGENDRKIVRETMEKVGILSWSEQLFCKLSDGQKQKVLLARALTQQPEILVLDEPTSYLDIKHKVEFLSILRKRAREDGLTVILSLHEVELALCVSDTIACLKNGVLERYGKTEEVCRDDYLLQLYDIHMENVESVFYDYIDSYGK